MPESIRPIELKFQMYQKSRCQFIPMVSYSTNPRRWIATVPFLNSAANTFMSGGLSLCERGQYQNGTSIVEDIPSRNESGRLKGLSISSSSVDSCTFSRITVNAPELRVI